MQYFLTCGVLVQKCLKEVIRTICVLCFFCLASILAGFNVGDFVFEVMVYADTTRCSGVSHKEFLLSHAGHGLLHQGRHPLPTGTTSLYTMARSVCTSLQTLDAGRETTVAVSTMADPTVERTEIKGESRSGWGNSPSGLQCRATLKVPSASAQRPTERKSAEFLFQVQVDLSAERHSPFCARARQD